MTETETRIKDLEQKVGALARLIFELDDIARAPKDPWFSGRALRRLQVATEKASNLATQPDLVERVEKILSGRGVLEL